jgi:hypothetical protein
VFKLVPEEAGRSYFQEISSWKVIADLEREESNISHIDTEVISYLLRLFKANADLTTYPAAFTALNALKVILENVSCRFVRHNNHLTY